MGTGVRLLMPALIMTLLLMVIIFQPSFATHAHPSSTNISNVPKCTTSNDDGKCITLLYNINADMNVNSWPTYFADDLDYSSGYWDDEKAAVRDPIREANPQETSPEAVQDVLGLSKLKDLFLSVHNPRPAEPSPKAGEPVFSKRKSTSEKVMLETVEPTKEYADAVMRILCENNNDKLTFGVDVQFTEMADNVLREYLYQGSNANSTLGAIEFLPITTDVDGVVTINYRLIYNGTIAESFKISGAEEQFYGNNIRFNMEAALEKSMMMYFAQTYDLPFDSASVNIGLKDFPSSTAEATQSLVWMLSVPVLLVIIGVNYLYTQVNMSADKETGRRGQMKLAGLRDSVYWVACIARQWMFCIFALLLAVMVGWLAPAFLMFDAPYLVIVMYLFTFNIYFCATASLISVFLKTRKMAIVLSSLLFGLFLVIVFFLSLFSGALLFAFWGRVLFINTGLLLSGLFPPFAFSAIASMLLLNNVPSISSISCYGSSYSVEGFTWSMFFGNPVPNVTDSSSSCVIAVTPPFWILVVIGIEAILIYFLAYWLDKVRSDEHKASLPFFFFLMPSYWFQTREPEKASGDSALVIEHLTKTYKKGFFSTEGVTAIRPFQMNAAGDSVLCLLGPNGAGKTTIIGCLTGLVPPSEGDASIFGYSISSNMDAIRSMMGVCPQFDMLFDNLSAWEHMRIVNWLKRPCDRMTTDELAQRLDDVRLSKVAHQATKTYSGGMKRRLSVVLATVGNPRIIFLDEPSTGMDPGNRRYVWDLVRKIKKGCLIVLTTHSMEEADMLGDQIAIVAAGKLRCEGTPLELKGRFGLGYRLTISCDPDNTETVKRLVNRHLPGAQLRGDNAGALVYSLPDLDGSSSEFFELLQTSVDDNGNKLVDDWGCQNTTMEDVFLTVTRKIMGQDITFDSSNKKSQLDRDEREIFRESSHRFERRIRYLKEEVEELRAILTNAGMDVSEVLSAADREEKLMIQ